MQRSGCSSKGDNNINVKHDDINVYEDDFSLLHYFITSFLSYVLSFIVVFIVFVIFFRGTLTDLKNIVEDLRSLDNNVAINLMSRDDKVSLGTRSDIDFLLKDSKYQPSDIDSNLEYCIGDVIETDIAKLQVISCYKSGETEMSDVYTIDFILSNIGMYSGLTMNENTGVFDNNSPVITINTLDKVFVSKPLELDDKSFNTVINRGSTQAFSGKVHVDKGDRPSHLTSKCGKKYNQINTVSLNYEVKELEPMLEYIKPYTDEGVFKANCHEIFNIDGITFNVEGRYYRNPDSTYHRDVRGECNKDIAVFLEMTNNAGERKPLAEMFDFILVDSKGRMYKESIYSDVENQINNTVWRPVVVAGEKINGVLNFEAHEDFHKLLIKRRVEESGKSERVDEDFIVAVNLNKY